MPYLAQRTLSDTPQEHLDDHNNFHPLLNQLQTAAQGSRIINVQNPPDDVSDVAAVGDNATDDNVALQNIFDYLDNNLGAHHVVWFPFRNANGNSARYLTSKPLRVWTNTHIIGPATISPHSSFDWVNHPYVDHPMYKPEGNAQPGDIGLIELWNEGTSRGGSSRLFLNDITIDCLHQPGSLGLFTKCQQPGYFFKVRIDNCAKAGWQLWGQQVDVFMTEMIDCAVGLYLGPDLGGLGTFGAAGTSCKFMSFYSLNIEGYTDAAIKMDCDGPNWFYGLHHELRSQDDAGINIVDCMSGDFTLRNGWGTHGGNTNTVFKIGDKTPTPGPTITNYVIEDFKIGGGNTGGQLWLDDKVRGVTRLVDLHRKIDSIRTLLQNDTQHDYDACIEYLGDEGGFVRIGGVKGGTAAPAGHSGAQFSTRANNGQDERQVRFYQSDGTLRAGVHQSGNLVLGSYNNTTRPAANTLEAGTVIWNTDDNAINLSDGSAWRDAMGTTT